MAWAKIQSTSNPSQAADPRTLAFASNVTLGSLLIFFHQWGTGSGTATFSKSSGTATVGAFTTIKNVNDATDGQSAALGWCLVTGTGSLTIQATDSIPSGNFCQLSIHEISGNDNNVTVDGNNGQATASLNPTSGAFTPVNNGCLIFQGGVDTAGGGTVTKGAAYTSAETGGVNLNVTGFLTQAVAALITPAMINSVNEATIVIAAAFTPAASGGGFFNQRRRPFMFKPGYGNQGRY